MSRERDYSYEALAAATATDMVQGRGELNHALKSIRDQEPELTDYALADEIHRRAKNYPDVIGDVVLTPSALCKHWRRCAVVPKQQGSNMHGRDDCETCAGNRMVFVGCHPGTEFETYCPCPDCNAVEISFWRYDGKKVSTPDPGRVRELMNG